MNKKYKTGEEVRTKLLDFLKSHRVTLSPVSIREIAKATGIKSTSVVDYHLGVLEEEGKIKRNPYKARMIEVVEE